MEFCSAEMSFFVIGLLCMSRKTPLSRIKKISLAETLRTSLKAVFFAQKLLLHVPFFAIRKKFPFSQTKRFSFAQTFPYSHPKQLFSTLCHPFQPTLTYCPQKFPVFTNQKLFFRTNLSLLPSKATLFHPPLPISTPLNLLFAKNTAVLLMFA